MNHNYYESINYEKTWHPIADAFYLSKYNDCTITRYTDDSPEHLSYQKKDIDLSITIGDRVVHISEKFRKTKYNDLLIEMYSKYPKKLGWMEENKADYIAYFNEELVYIVEKNSLINWWIKLDFINSFKEEISQFHEENENKSARKKLNDEITLIQAFNTTKDAQWHTISIAVLWDKLINEGLSIKKFTLTKT